MLQIRPGDGGLPGLPATVQGGSGERRFWILSAVSDGEGENRGFQLRDILFYQVRLFRLESFTNLAFQFLSVCFDFFNE